MRNQSERRQITLRTDWAFGIEGGEQVEVIDEQAQYDGDNQWLVSARWNGHQILVNNYGRIISG